MGSGACQYLKPALSPVRGSRLTEDGLSVPNERMDKSNLVGWQGTLEVHATSPDEESIEVGGHGRHLRTMGQVRR